MPEQLYALTEEQVERLSRTNRRVETLLDGYNANEHLPGVPPVWIYVGKTQEAIPEIAGNIPGSGLVKLHKLNIDTGALDPTELDPITCYNANDCYIPANAWVILNRDPYSGKYFLSWSVCVSGSADCCLSAGCGIIIKNNIISVDAEAIAGKGLEKGETICEIQAKLGCGLEFSATDEIEIDTTVAGSLIQEFVTDVNLSLAGSQLKLTKEYATLTLSWNDCGVLIGAAISGQRTSTNTVDGCCTGSGSSSGSV